jgi:NADH:ubiquinone oxidoreductase subunit 4 (chain M)
MLLLLVTFAPIVAAIVIMIGFPARLTALAASLLTLLISAIIFLRFNALGGFQFVVTFPISSELGLNFTLGVDGLSLLMILLGAIVCSPRSGLPAKLSIMRTHFTPASFSSPVAPSVPSLRLIYFSSTLSTNSR